MYSSPPHPTPTHKEAFEVWTGTILPLQFLYFHWIQLWFLSNHPYNYIIILVVLQQTIMEYLCDLHVIGRWVFFWRKVAIGSSTSATNLVFLLDCYNIGFCNIRCFCFYVASIQVPQVEGCIRGGLLALGQNQSRPRSLSITVSVPEWPFLISKKILVTISECQ